MFVPVVHARATMGEQVIGTDADVILVNRLYLRGVEQVDAAPAGEGAERIPGAAPGGASDDRGSGDLGGRDPGGSG